MSSGPIPPSDALAAGKRSKEPRKTRRRFLKALALGLPAAAGAAAGLGRAASDAREKQSAFPGDPAVWRDRFLADARSTEAVGVAEADVAVRERAQGAISAGALPRPAALAAPAPQAAPATAGDESILVLMQADLKRAMAKPIEQRSWAMAVFTADEPPTTRPAGRCTRLPILFASAS